MQARFELTRHGSTTYLCLTKQDLVMTTEASIHYPALKQRRTHGLFRRIRRALRDDVEVAHTC